MHKHNLLLMIAMISKPSQEQSELITVLLIPQFTPQVLIALQYLLLHTQLISIRSYSKTIYILEISLPVVSP